MSDNLNYYNLIDNPIATMNFQYSDLLFFETSVSNYLNKMYYLCKKN